MKLASWNVERLKHKSQLSEINSILDSLKADVLVLTETDESINLPNYQYCVQTPKLIEIEPNNYVETENRVTIYTNFEIINQFETYDKYTSLCVELQTDSTSLIVYGTIIGIYGNRHKNFNEDISKQIHDFNKLSAKGDLCIIGDYNISFADNYYFTSSGRGKLNRSFDRNDMELLTFNCKECIDHIAISRNFISNYSFEFLEWNENRKFSDHKGVCITLSHN